MLSAGNGTPQACARNLLAMARGECPYERCKGIDPDLVDAPLQGAYGTAAEEAAFVIRNYEPRAELLAASLIEDALSGGFHIGAALLTGRA